MPHALPVHWHAAVGHASASMIQHHEIEPCPYLQAAPISQTTACCMLILSLCCCLLQQLLLLRLLQLLPPHAQASFCSPATLCLCSCINQRAGVLRLPDPAPAGQQCSNGCGGMTDIELRQFANHNRTDSSTTPTESSYTILRVLTASQPQLLFAWLHWLWCIKQTAQAVGQQRSQALQAHSTAVDASSCRNAACRRVFTLFFRHAE